MWNLQEPEAPEEDVDYWMSYSDLMAGLVLVFILLLVFFIAHSKKNLEEQQEILAIKTAELANKDKQLNIIDKDIERILGIRAEILRRVKTRFQQSGSEVTFDAKTGAIRLGSNILFEEGSARLSGVGKQTLGRVIPIYYEALLGDEKLREHVEQIVIEGHTNSNYSQEHRDERAYLFNLRLSQKRAYEAMEFIVEEGVGESYQAKSLLAANGYSHSRPILDESNIEDKERSRRIEIRFRLKDEESLSKLKLMFQTLEAFSKNDEQK